MEPTGTGQRGASLIVAAHSLSDRASTKVLPHATRAIRLRCYSVELRLHLKIDALEEPTHESLRSGQIAVDPAQRPHHIVRWRLHET